MISAQKLLRNNSRFSTRCGWTTTRGCSTCIVLTSSTLKLAPCPTDSSSNRLVNIFFVKLRKYDNTFKGPTMQTVLLVPEECLPWEIHLGRSKTCLCVWEAQKSHFKHLSRQLAGFIVEMINDLVFVSFTFNTLQNDDKDSYDLGQYACHNFMASAQFFSFSKKWDDLNSSDLV